MAPVQTTDLWPVLAIPAVVAGIFVLINLVLMLVAWIGGWKRLAAAYPGRPQPEGQQWRFRSLRFGGWVNYNNCVTMGGDREGLHLSMPWFFGAGHPRIFLPWADLRVAETTSVFGLFPMVGLEASRRPDLRLWVPAALMKEIQASVKTLSTAGLNEENRDALV